MPLINVLQPDKTVATRLSPSRTNQPTVPNSASGNTVSSRPKAATPSTAAVIIEISSFFISTFLSSLAEFTFSAVTVFSFTLLSITSTPSSMLSQTACMSCAVTSSADSNTSFLFAKLKLTFS